MPLPFQQPPGGRLQFLRCDALQDVKKSSKAQPLPMPTSNWLMNRGSSCCPPHDQASKESFSDFCGQLAFNVINRLTESAKVLASFSMLTREGHALKLMEALHEENGG